MPQKNKLNQMFKEKKETFSRCSFPNREKRSSNYELTPETRNMKGAQQGSM